jgi:hypothetical protein
VSAPPLLTGVQIEAMIQIVQQVTAGTLPRDSGIAMLTAAFGISLEEAEAIMAQAGQGFVAQEPERAANSRDSTADLTAPTVEKIIALAEGCRDYEEFKAKALGLLDGGQLNLDDLGEDLAGQMFLATLEGALNRG